MSPEVFVESLCHISLPNVFNPYTDTCSLCDHHMSSSIRRQNLLNYLRAVNSAKARCIWIGRDLGYRGGRRTGIPLTDEPSLELLSNNLATQSFSKATADSLVKERTATEVWKMVPRVREAVLLWNVFPLHPHEPESPMSNRSHKKLERETGLELLETLIEWLEPNRIIAIGNDAYHALLTIGHQAVLVRHPSYGGQNEFRRALQRIYDLENN